VSDRKFAHPYIPNSAPAIKSAMLKKIGVENIAELYSSIPTSLQFNQKLNIPPAIEGEYELRRHMDELLARNVTASESLSFLGQGCYQHIVPTICDEINTRAEFLTAYAGEPYEDHGKWQALFEYTSLMADLLEMDVVNIPCYDGYQASATALRMATRMTGRRVVLVEAAIDPEKYKKIYSYLQGAATVVPIPISAKTGRIDTSFVNANLNKSVAAIYFETPNALGITYPNIQEISDLAHSCGALAICGTDPLALGFIDSPASAGIDILCGDIQSLGLGMHFGGAHGGFIATHDEDFFVYELPSRLFGITPTIAEGEIGFTDVAYERTSLAMRENGIEWVGTAAALWGITAGVYLSLMGPHGMRELGEAIAAHTRYAIEKLRLIPGVEVLYPDEPHWREFAVRYTKNSVAEVQNSLLTKGIFAGIINERGNVFDNTMFFAVTEIRTTSDIDYLAETLQEIVI